ncbi:PQQ-dependent sugar dehydrogenase [Neobacillus dielmonensis]|uniref:PQQ-dependent sugar dehydrogenase n=1 Tax=Neobacillus dielmonensis TaxID=1347369 RepID=UPI0005A9C76A|nr:sorbosone dehydrogenase family protein [Neobacillus dielmonensis]
MYRFSSILLMFMLLMSGCSVFEKKEEVPGDEAFVLQPDVEVVADHLFVPWSINKLDGTFYISERTGSIVKIENGQVERQPVYLEPKLAQAAEAGLLGFILDPDFSTNRKAYAYYTYTDEAGGQYNRVVTLFTNGAGWSEDGVLLDKIPSAAYHHGGRLKMGPDGKLYITSGDGTNPETAQDLSSLNGKILRMNVDGTIPVDNPDPNSYVYSFGHRNPQGLAWVGDVLYASEHGQSAHDEINRIVPGANFGWPVIQGDETKAGMVTPLFHSGEETWAPSGMAAVDDKLYVAALRGNAVRIYDLEKKQTEAVVTGLGRIRDVLVDDDYLYFVSNNLDGRGTPDELDDKLYRVLVGSLK